jgi:hypothetical protein
VRELAITPRGVRIEYRMAFMRPLKANEAMQELCDYLKGCSKNDPLLALRGSGKKLWADEHTDEYVKRLREGWE